MSEEPETLWSYCKGNKRCIPKDWHEFFLSLKALPATKSDESKPPVPLILAAWNFTIPLEKHIRFKEQVEWADRHGHIAAIGAYLRGLAEDDWYHFGDAGLPSGDGGFSE